MPDTEPVVSLVVPIVSVVQSKFVTVAEDEVKTVISPEALLIVPETRLPSKPLSDFTGPLKVVLPILNTSHASQACQSACRQSGLSGKQKIFPIPLYTP